MRSLTAVLSLTLFLVHCASAPPVPDDPAEMVMIPATLQMYAAPDEDVPFWTDDHEFRNGTLYSSMTNVNVAGPSGDVMLEFPWQVSMSNTEQRTCFHVVLPEEQTEEYCVESLDGRPWFPFRVEGHAFVLAMELGE